MLRNTPSAGEGMLKGEGNKLGSLHGREGRNDAGAFKYAKGAARLDASEEGWQNEKNCKKEKNKIK